MSLLHRLTASVANDEKLTPDHVRQDVESKLTEQRRALAAHARLRREAIQAERRLHQ